MNTFCDLPDYHALIARIRDIDRSGGDSTLARLVAADWLQEHGEEGRAYLIRAFVEHLPADALLRVAGNDGGKAVYFGEQFGLPIDFLDCDLVGFDRPKSVVVSSNGLVDTVECPLDWWFANGPDVCRRHPVRRVFLTDRFESDGAAFDTPALVWAEDSMITTPFDRQTDGNRGARCGKHQVPIQTQEPQAP